MTLTISYINDERLKGYNFFELLSGILCKKVFVLTAPLFESTILVFSIFLEVSGTLVLDISGTFIISYSSSSNIV